MNFIGEIALVTGGTGDIGGAIVTRLVNEGLKVALTYHSNQAAAQRLVETLGQERVWALPVNENNLAEARLVVSKIRSTWGVVNFLVNSVGMIRDSSMVRMEEEDWVQVRQVNLDAVFAFCRAVVFEQIKQQKGAIVNLSSIAGMTGSVGQVNYAAAKAGVIGLTKAMAREMGHFQVRVNAVAPGYIASRMTEKLPEKMRQLGLSLIPMKRFGRPEEVAAAVAFLLSEDARYINGQTLVVDGGIL